MTGLRSGGSFGASLTHRANATRSGFAKGGVERQPEGERPGSPCRTASIPYSVGRSNRYRVRAWKAELARLATETGLNITVSHYPPGTSKWNRIDHRMFSFITMNWRGRPLVSYHTIIELIWATTTETGLTIRGERDTEWYPAGVKITDAEMTRPPLT